MDKTAGVRVRLVVDYPADAERVDVAERADVVAVRLPLLLVILPLQEVLEAVGRAVGAVVRRRVDRVASRDGRPVADGGSRDRWIIGSLEDRSRSSRGSAIICSLRSLISL